MLFEFNKEQRKYDITIQVTGDCNLACAYCYQHDKNTKKVDVKKAKKFVKAILDNDQTFLKGYADFSIPDIQVCLQFIGGEPFVNYKAIIEICDYTYDYCKENKLQIWDKLLFGICTNGTIYNKEIEQFIKKYNKHISLAISIDGNKKLHDSCRLYKNGNPSYDKVIENLYKYRKLLCRRISTKFTVSHDNLSYLYDGTINMFKNLGFTKVPANCVYEDVWQKDDPTRLYQQLKQIADYFLHNDCIVEDYDPQSNNHKNIQFGFFSSNLFNPEVDFDMCYCGGNGNMLFMQYDGKIYNCNRYSEVSIGNPDRDLFIGTVDEGIYKTDVVQCLQCVTRNTMYDEQCKKCPVGRGCGDCLAYCYEVQGEFKKLKTICDMHKARSLANVYFWNKYYIQHNIDKCMLMHLPIRDARRYIDDDEINMLLELSNKRYINSMNKKEEQ